VSDPLTITGLIISNIVALAGIALGLLNYFSKRSEVLSKGKVDNAEAKVKDADALNSLSKAVDLANERALKAEQRSSSLEDEFRADRKEWIKERGEMLTEIEGLRVVVEKTQQYRIMFDVILGVNAEILGASIKHVTDRRKEDVPFTGEDRRANK